MRGIDTDRDKQQIVSNIVAYAHARSMQLIAEGIETEAQLRTVIGLGVDLLQGLLPQPPRRSARPHCTGSPGGDRPARTPAIQSSRFMIFFRLPCVGSLL